MLIQKKTKKVIIFIVIFTLFVESLNWYNMLMPYSINNGKSVIALENNNLTHKTLIREDFAWYCYDENNVKCKGWVWIQDKKSWFYFSPKTYKMQTGWMQIGEDTYYFNSDGTAYKGWFLDESQNAWFYFDDKGKMRKGWVEDKKAKTKYFLSETDGKMQTGLVQIHGKDYYFQANGVLRTGWYYDKSENAYFYFKASGEACKGWTWIENKHAKFYFSPIDGRMETGIIYVNGDRYYLSPETGALQIGEIMVNGVPYTTDKNGKILENVNSLKIDENKNLQFYSNDTVPSVNTSSILTGKKGIDVSQWQGENIDWAAVKSSGVEYVMIRSNYGWRGKDLRFHDNITQAKNAGLKVGVYLYSYATNVQEAKMEFQNLIATIKNYKLDYPVAYDLEDSCQLKLSKEQMTNIACTFCDLVQKAGYKPMIYASTSWLTDRLDYKKISKYYLWVAQYNNSCNYSYRNPPDIWQYSSTGTISGIDGYVDMDCAYRDF